MASRTGSRDAGNAASRGSPHRLFFALRPSGPVRNAIARAASQLDDATGGRAIAPERYHLTVLFLGDFYPLPEALLSAAMEAGASMRVGPFVLSIDRMGRFPGSRVLWLGPGTRPSGLLALHDGLEQALAPHLPAPVPAFVPHVTIRRNVRAPPPVVALPGVRWPVRDFELIDSQPGAPYRRVGQWPLAP